MDDVIFTAEDYAELEGSGRCSNCGHTWECHEAGGTIETKKRCPDPVDPMLHECPPNA